MKYTRVQLAGLGYQLGPEVVTTEELEERIAPALRALRIPLGQLESMTGIHERRYWEPGYPLTHGAAAAACKALDRSGIPADALGSLIYAGVCREHFEPATACHVAAALQDRGYALAPQTAVYDLSNACLGMLSGALEIANRIELGQIRAGMVVSCESARDIVEIAIANILARPDMQTFSHSLATLTGGSGAAALILSDGSLGQNQRGELSPPGQARRLVAAVTRTAPRHHNLCRWGISRVPPEAPSAAANEPRYAQFMSTDATAVLEHGIALGKQTWGDLNAELAQAYDGTVPQPLIDRVVCHQVGATHRQAILHELGIAPEDDFVAYDYLGNTGTVALPLALALATERGFLQTGQRVGLLGIGSGLNCLMLGVQW